MPEKNSNEIPIYHVNTIANPPPSGVGMECKLRSLGMLKILFFKAKRLIRNVNKNEQNPRITINNIIFNGQSDLS